MVARLPGSVNPAFEISRSGGADWDSDADRLFVRMKERKQKMDRLAGNVRGLPQGWYFITVCPATEPD